MAIYLESNTYDNFICRDSEKSTAVSPTCIASSAKDIAIEETVKTLKTSLGPNKETEDTNTSG